MPQILEAPTESVLIRNVSWKTYESFLDDYQDENSIRLAFDKGVMEIMSPSPKHEIRSVHLSDLIITLGEEWNIEMVGLGSTTFKRADIESGFEPDSCFYVQNASVMFGVEEVDLSRGDLPPDLVAEIEGSSPSLPKLPLYKSIGVPEVWRVDKLGGVKIHLLDGTEYKESKFSRCLPRLSRLALEGLLSMSNTGGLIEWRRRVRAWAQEHD